MSIVPEEHLLDPAGRVRMLSNAGSSVVVDAKIPALRYYRSGPQMEKMARTYYAEGQWEQAFVLYNKFATLFVEKLPKHPGYSKVTPADKTRVNKLLNPAFERALELKKKLKEKFEQERDEHVMKMETEAAAKRAEEERKRELRERQEREKEKQVSAFLAADTTPTATSSARSPAASPQLNTTREPEPPGSYPGTQPAENRTQPPAHENQPLPPAYEEVAVEQPSAPGVLSSVQSMDDDDDTEVRDDMLLMGDTIPDDDDLDDESAQSDAPMLMDSAQHQAVDSSQRSVTATNMALAKVLPDTYQAPPNHFNQPPYSSQYASPHTTAMPTAYQYAQQPTPYAPPPDASSYGAPPPGSVLYGAPPPAPYGAPPPAPYGAPPSGYDAPGYQESSHRPPPSPPSTIYSNPNPVVKSAPEVNRGTKPVTSALTSLVYSNPNPVVESAPEVNRRTKPVTSALTSLGGNEGMKRLFVPTDTASRFLELASSNTRRDVETCGILAGKFAQNQLRVTHIVVPKQTGKSDSCETLNEEEIFDVQDKYDLITLGWIHTHPSQTSFMSSVDLHTHCSYQIMLEEAIAIVCAPRYNQTGVFSLTQPHGVSYISNCTQKGFHSHPKEPPLYEECKHIQFSEDTRVEIVDLR